MSSYEPLHGVRTISHDGVQKNTDLMVQLVFDDIFAYQGSVIADMPNTAAATCGGFHKKLANHGFTRTSWITNFRVAGFTQRTWKDWKGARHWHCSVVVSYDGVTLNAAEGGGVPSGPAPSTGNIDLSELKADLGPRIGQ